MKRVRCLGVDWRYFAAVIGCWILNTSTGAADTRLVMIQSAPGRFEIAAADASLAHALADDAAEAWRHLAGPLGLPESFPTPVYVRVVGPDPGEANPVPFRVTVEQGGIVSLRLATEAALQSSGRHGLVQALLMRLAVSRHGASARLASPLWLEHACLEWWRTRADGAQWDALKQESARTPLVPLDALLNWHHGQAEPRSLVVAATWLLTWLQAENGAGEWPAFRDRLLGGEMPLAALNAVYTGRWNDLAERELWWRTGYHHVRQQRTLPTLDAVESRTRLGALTRFVFADRTGDGDAVVSLREVMQRASEPVLTADIERRAAELRTWLTALHPFYRNAGLALADVFAATGAPAEKREALAMRFEEDWRDALELAAATRQALDRMERGAVK